MLELETSQYQMYETLEKTAWTETDKHWENLQLSTILKLPTLFSEKINSQIYM